MIADGKCYNLQWPKTVEKTICPDKELICSIYGTKDCAEKPKFSTKALLDDIGAYSPEESRRFANRTYGFVSGIEWPGVENFQTNWGIYWRLNVIGFAPKSFVCYHKGGQVGIGKETQVGLGKNF